MNYDLTYYTDFPTEPIGKPNPYYQCCYCKIPVPQINGMLTGHTAFCQYRQDKEYELQFLNQQ